MFFFLWHVLLYSHNIALTGKVRSVGISKPFLCFPWERDSCSSERVMGLCFGEERGREGLLQRSWGLRANSCSSVPSYRFLSHCAGSYLGLNKLLFLLMVCITSSQGVSSGREEGCAALTGEPRRDETWVPQGWGACGLPTGRGLLFSLLWQKQKKWEESVRL